MLSKLVSGLKGAWVFRRQQPSTDALCSGDADAGALVAEDCDRLIHNGRAAPAEGDMVTATDCYRDAVSRAPGNPAFRVALAFVLTEQGRYEEAWPQLDEAVRLRPDDPDIHLQRGNFQCEVGELENARWCYLEALALRPGHVEVHANLGHVLVRQGALAAAIASFEHALLHDSGHLRAHSNLLLALSLQSDGLDGRYVREARRYGEKVAAVAKPYREWLVDLPAQGVPRVLRAGLVSGDLRCHAVMAVLEGVLRQLDPGKIEWVAYSMNPLDDEVTERVKGYFSQWTPVAGMSDEALAQRIHGDRVDILIDLAGHSAHNRLPVFAWKPAPVQVSWLGYLASTGVPGMDYVLADPVCAPESAQAQFTEEIWHLPETLNCYTPPAEHPQLAVAALPALRNGYITFGSFQRINKISDATVGAWARILNMLPQATLRLRNEAMSSESARGQLQLRLTQAGIAAERVTYGGNIPGREEYLAAYGEVDIILDTFPYPGVTTTCEALWMGVPTVTLARGAVLGRIGASVLTCAGLTDWVAWSEDEYVNLAVRHGSDVTGLARLRAGLRQQVTGTALFDASRFAPQLENALIAMCRRRAS